MTITITLKSADATGQPDASQDVYQILKTLTERVSEGGLHYLPGNVRNSAGVVMAVVKVEAR